MNEVVKRGHSPAASRIGSADLISFTFHVIMCMISDQGLHLTKLHRPAAEATAA